MSREYEAQVQAWTTSGTHCDFADLVPHENSGHNVQYLHCYMVSNKDLFNVVLSQLPPGIFSESESGAPAMRNMLVDGVVVVVVAGGVERKLHLHLPMHCTQKVHSRPSVKRTLWLRATTVLSYNPPSCQISMNNPHTSVNV